MSAFSCDLEDCETCAGLYQFWKLKAIEAKGRIDQRAERQALDALSILEREHPWLGTNP